MKNGPVKGRFYLLAGGTGDRRLSSTGAARKSTA